jgi:hypothetical protein
MSVRQKLLRRRRHFFWWRITIDYSQRYSESGLIAFDDCERRLSIVGCMS